MTKQELEKLKEKIRDVVYELEHSLDENEAYEITDIIGIAITDLDNLRIQSLIIKAIEYYKDK